MIKKIKIKIKLKKYIHVYKKLKKNILSILK